MDLVATSSSNKAPFKVKINFRNPSTLNDSSIVSSSTNVLLSSSLADYMDRMVCNDDGTCVDPINSRFTCHLDDVDSVMVCGLDLLKKNITTG